jgi:autotransporter-associated beta strand protein
VLVFCLEAVHLAVRAFIGRSGIYPTSGTARVIANTGGTFDVSRCCNLTAGSIEGAGRFQRGGAILTVGGLNTDTTLSGTIADGGIGGGSAQLVKQGVGKLTLSGANTYTGVTTINGGTLAVNGSIPGAVTVNTSVTLNGTGTIGGNVTVAAGGILSPGNSAGTLMVGSLTLTSANSGSVLNVELGGATPGTQYDQIHVLGQATTRRHAPGVAPQQLHTASGQRVRHPRLGHA